MDSDEVKNILKMTTEECIAYGVMIRCSNLSMYFHQDNTI